jgi:hypothetical protein
VERVTKRLVAWPAVGTLKLVKVPECTTSSHQQEQAIPSKLRAFAAAGPWQWQYLRGFSFELCTHMTSCLASCVANVSLAQHVAQVLDPRVPNCAM